MSRVKSVGRQWKAEVFFVCQEEDGIRVRSVTGVQTGALAILGAAFLVVVFLAAVFLGATFLVALVVFLVTFLGAALVVFLTALGATFLVVVFLTAVFLAATLAIAGKQG